MITATGKCMGVSVEEFVNKQTGETRTTRKIGIGMKKERSKYDEDQHIFEVTLDQKTDLKAVERINALKGKMVNVGAIPSPYEMNGKKGVSFKWNGQITEVGAKPAELTKVA